MEMERISRSVVDPRFSVKNGTDERLSGPVQRRRTSLAGNIVAACIPTVSAPARRAGSPDRTGAEPSFAARRVNSIARSRNVSIEASRMRTANRRDRSPLPASRGDVQSGSIDIDPLIINFHGLDESVEALDVARDAPPAAAKVQFRVNDSIYSAV